MTLKVVTMRVTCEECDVEDVKKELEEWYVSNKIGMSDISFD